MKTIPAWVTVSIIVISLIGGILTVGANYVTIREYLDNKKAKQP